MAASAFVCLPAQSPPAGFTYETLVDGPLNSGTAMAFLPNGDLLITERETGHIRVWRDGALLASPWATVPANGGGSYAEQGLLGIAVDPDFLHNRYVYVYYTESSGTENRIARLQEVGGFGTGLTNLTLPGALPSQLYHNGGPLVVGQDGCLYVATGDGLSSSNATDMQNWLGKTLRFTLPDLTIPADNPFASSPFPSNAIYSLGHRNQFGLAINPLNGGLYQTENGGALKDEINHIIAGGDYGWPTYEGNEPVQNPAFVDPLAWYQPTTAPTGMCFYTGDHYPAAYHNAWFWMDYNLGRLHQVNLDAAGNTVLSQSIFDTPSGAGYGVATGPDGNLYVLVNDMGGYGADELGRYVHVNEPLPSAQLSAVSNKSLGGTVTACVHAPIGSIVARWLSLTRLATPVPTVFGNLWVPLDAMMSVALVTYDERSFLPLSLPNNP
ncbi:MAG: PQQ-dependent sugar dehydrogenase, partial [Gemmataceae bacterium]